jgi:hypothetical protein
VAILIDGYNLLHATGILGRKVGPGTLERARNALLRFLATSLTDSERAETTVVFDANNGPPGLPREQYHQGIHVLYAQGYADADGLMEQLIRADSSPRRLVVVSSDHQVQRAARRRRATAVDSDRWHADVCRQRRGRDAADGEASEADGRPIQSSTEAELASWVEAFSELAVADASEPAAVKAKHSRGSGGKVKDTDVELTNPFPPGYADDLLTDEVGAASKQTEGA